MNIYLLTFLSISLSLHGVENNKDLPMQTQPSTTTPASLSRTIEVGKTYKHYSGKLYKVIAIAHDSEDPAVMRVIYRGLYDCPTFGPNPVWDRPYAMFAEDVVINNIVQQRFALVASE
jgi:hypothetical protein